jgi:hypothetical protein
MGTGCLDARSSGSGGCLTASCVSVSPFFSVLCSRNTDGLTASCFPSAPSVKAFCSLVCSVNSNAYVEVDKHTLWLNPTDVFNISSNTNWIII